MNTNCVLAILLLAVYVQAVSSVYFNVAKVSPSNSVLLCSLTDVDSTPPVVLSVIYTVTCVGSQAQCSGQYGYVGTVDSVFTFPTGSNSNRDTVSGTMASQKTFVPLISHQLGVLNTLDIKFTSDASNPDVSITGECRYTPGQTQPLLIATAAPAVPGTGTEQFQSFNPVVVRAGETQVIGTVVNVDTDLRLSINYTFECNSSSCTTWDGEFVYRNPDTSLSLGNSLSIYSASYGIVRRLHDWILRGTQSSLEISFHNKNYISHGIISGSIAWVTPDPHPAGIESGALAGAIIGVLLGVCCLCACLLLPCFTVMLVCLGCVTLPASIGAAAATIGIRNRREDVNIHLHSASPSTPQTNYSTAV